MNKKSILTILIAFLLVSTFSLDTNAENKKWFEENQFIYHAHGGINGIDYTNSKEALEQTYRNGGKVFESDIVLTSDDIIVARHGWGEFISHFQQQDVYPKDKTVLTYDEFINMKIRKVYTPMSFEDIVRFMSEHKDTYLVTDTKTFSNKDVNKYFNILVDTVNKIDSSVLSRIVPQIYNQKMLEYIDEVYPFESIIYTLYASADKDEQVVEFVKNGRIDVVTMWTHRATPEFVEKLHEQNVAVYAHTTNNIEEITLLKSYGVDGFYTDYVYPLDFSVKQEGLKESKNTININNEEFIADQILLNGVTFISEEAFLNSNLGITLGEANKTKLVLNGKSVTYNIGDKTIGVNGKNTELLLPSFKYDNKNYIPLRSIAEGLGIKVNWDPATKKIDLQL